MRLTLAILMALMLAACESKLRGPVPLERDDACASCRMLISERRFAAELIDRDGEVYKFDDIACMLRFAHSHAIQLSSAKFYVTDYATGSHWIEARDAHFIRLRSAISSPMASGIVAFRDANAGASKNKDGNLLSFEEVWSKEIGALNGNSADPAKR